MNVSLFFLLAVLVLNLTASDQVPVQTNMESRVQRLEETIRTLEKRLATLEAKQGVRITPFPASSDKATWRKLKKGMSKEEVENLLGSPTKIDEFGTFTNWDYAYPSRRRGSVKFDDESKLEGWHEP